ncbi:MAG: hypothetical protein Q8P41_09695 [Pseudomonadota bacterium]|nr:hypothetical protein [Pseudomonadota bacterium]
MASPKTRGRCDKCGKDFANAAMGTHLAACIGAGPGLLVAVDVGPGTWWMHFALAPTATLLDLDKTLRALWLECCGHMSAFEIAGTRFESSTEGWQDFGWGPKPRSMAAKVGSVLQPGAGFGYEYDFGSTTALRGRVLGTIAPGRAKVTLLARNAPIVWPCDGEACTAAATRVCPYCSAMACPTCDAPCDCLDDFAADALPVVNSPRMGVCAYTG